MKIDARIPRWTLLLGFAGSLGSGCKKQPTCDPRTVDWGVQLAVQATTTINPGRDGNALPTVVRFYQIRGELALDGLDFAKLWESEDVESLGEGFLSVMEASVRPGSTEVRDLPLDPEATHVVAAALFREHAGSTWFGTYEIPRRHPEIVCARSPKERLYPDPCFYILLDRNTVRGGSQVPAGYTPNESLDCAPPGETARPKKNQRGRKLDLDDPLRDADMPEAPDIPEPKQPDLRTPEAPDLPKPKGPNPPGAKPSTTQPRPPTRTAPRR